MLHDADVPGWLDDGISLAQNEKKQSFRLGLGGCGIVANTPDSKKPATAGSCTSYLLLNGGKVVGTLFLVNAGRSKEFLALKKHIRLLEARFGDEIKDIFGIHIPALTANEASYLVGFRTADEIRNRCAKAEKETAKRLLSKDHTGSAGQ